MPLKSPSLAITFPVGVNDDDLVLLIGANPQVVVAVDRDAVRGVDAGDEDRRRAAGVAGTPGSG